MRGTKEARRRMAEVTVVIPNYNGLRFLTECIGSLNRQTFHDFEVIVVDNGSSDESVSWLTREAAHVKIIRFRENLGFSRAVNAGIQAAHSPLVILLNNDTQAEPEFVARLYAAACRHPRAFALGARMMRYYDRTIIDDAGDMYNALGWAYARGKGKTAERYLKECQVFAACAGAAIYRRELFEKTGYFDDEHFAYLEDIDIGWRARLYGYENWYVPDAVVYHIGSGTSGSRYNQFKTRYSSRNNVYMVYKNMPALQILMNLPFLAAGFGIKLLYFSAKGLGREYAAGIWNGIQLCHPERKVPWGTAGPGRYARIQVELLKNLILYFFVAIMFHLL